MDHIIAESMPHSTKPVIATIIALAGLSAAFWERKNMQGVINLPEAKK